MSMTCASIVRHERTLPVEGDGNCRIAQLSGMRGHPLRKLINMPVTELITEVGSSTCGRRWPLILWLRHLSDSEARWWWPATCRAPRRSPKQKCDHQAMMAAACLGPSWALWTASRSGRRPSPTLLSRSRPDWGRSPLPSAGDRRRRARPSGPAFHGRGGPISPCPCRCASISPILRARRGRAPCGREEHPGAPRSPLPQASQIVGPQPAVAVPAVLPAAVRAEALALLGRYDARGPRLVYGTLRSRMRSRRHQLG